MPLLRSPKISIDTVSPVATPVPSCRLHLRHRVASKLEHMCSATSTSTSTQTPRSSLSSYDDDTASESISSVSSSQFRAGWRRLSRIEAVRAEHSIRKHDHRYYIVHIYLKSSRLPLRRRDPDYSIETTYASFFSARDAILQSSERHARDCFTCATRVRLLREHHDRPHDLNRLLHSPHVKEQRLERCLHGLVALAIQPSPVDTMCDGCAIAMHKLATFLQRQYTPTTGLI